MMRRYEPQLEPRNQNYGDQESNGVPPFRVLSPGGRILYAPQAVLRSPPSSRAPEPYKVAPQASSYGRTQRKSSFAIIAEQKPPSPRPRSRPDGLDSPPPQSGRLSPFRGRGFKGPLPRSRSGRLSPPPNANEPKRGRYHRRGNIVFTDSLKTV